MYTYKHVFVFEISEEERVPESMVGRKRPRDHPPHLQPNILSDYVADDAKDDAKDDDANLQGSSNTPEVLSDEGDAADDAKDAKDFFNRYI